MADAPQSRGPDVVPASADAVRWSFLASVGLVTLGMILTIAGFLASPLLLPGIYAIGLGMLGLALAGVFSAWVAATFDASAPPKKGA